LGLFSNERFHPIKFVSPLLERILETTIERLTLKNTNPQKNEKYVGPLAMINVLSSFVYVL